MSGRSSTPCESWAMRGAGNGRGCGRGRGGRWRPQTTPLSNFEVPLAPALGKCLRILSHDDLNLEQRAEEYKDTAKITDCSLVGSYSWTKAKEPTILIPGTPPRWTPPTTPPKLQEDSGPYLRDRNAAHFRSHPLEPAIISCLHISPDLNKDENIDIVACASTLGNLLRFVRGDDDHHAKSFRILVEKVGNTVFFTRRENSPRELIPGVRGYGHTFPEAYTTWDEAVKGSEGYHRVVGYMFDGLKCLVRFEVDGYVKSPEQESGRVRESEVDTLPPRTTGRNGRAWPAGLLEDMERVRLSEGVSEAVKGYKIEGGGLGIKYVGEAVPQESIFDIKTRSIRKVDEDIVSSEIPRFWVRQVPAFILGFHKNGMLEDVRTIDVGDEVAKWEQESADVLAKLAAVVRIIVEEVGRRKDKKIELCHMHTGKLELREQLADAGSVLSAEVKKEWEARVPGRASPSEEKGTDEES